MKLWGGRFTKGTNSTVEDFHSSIRFDSRLYEQDILGSIAHAKMLKKMEIIPADDADKIVSTLKQIMVDIEAGKVEFTVGAEDIHMNVETILIDRIGDAGKRLHTGRSRNDQVALDSRMYTMHECDEIIALLKALCNTLITIAGSNLDTIMPGYTHMQKAQPITLGFHMMAYVQMLLRDIDRINDNKKRVDMMPLGSGALAGTTYPLDRDYVAAQLGFSQITQNALDGVSDRDFVADMLYACSIIMMHLSRFCEEVVLWATGEFSFIELDDGFSTGSSIMPQKKNPDVAELIRGKTGRVYGDLMGILTVMKGLPLAYNKDTQEDKEGLFDGIDTVKGCIGIMDSMMSTASFNKDSMKTKAANGFTNATDAADYLVYKGIPFRQAHEIIGNMVLTCINENKSLAQLTVTQLKEYSPLIEEDFYETIHPMNCVNKRSLIGGPAPSAVTHSIEVAKGILDQI